MRKIITRIIIFLLMPLLGCFAYFYLYQNDTLYQKTEIFIVKNLEKILSTGGQTVHLSHIENIFSDTIKIAQITIEDAAGTWLTIKNTTLKWNRLSLLMGKIDIEKLNVETIDMARKPIKEYFEPFHYGDNAKSYIFQLLPLKIALKNLSIEKIHLNKAIAGKEGLLTLKGALWAAKDDYNIQLNAYSLKKTAELNLATHFNPKKNKADIDLHIYEAPNGILSHYFQLNNNEPVIVSLTSSGPYDKLKMKLALHNNKKYFLKGDILTTKINTGRYIKANIDGLVYPLLPKKYRSFFLSNTKAQFETVLQNDGDLDIKNINFKNQFLKVNGNAKILQDGFLRQITLEAALSKKDKILAPLPFLSEKSQAENILFKINYGTKDQQKWDATLDLQGFQTENFLIPKAHFNLYGKAKNLDNRKKRLVTINLKGEFQEQNIKNPKEKYLLETTLQANVHGTAPLEIPKAIIYNKDFLLQAKGHLQNNTFTGTVATEAKSLSPIGVLIGKELQGKLNFETIGSINLYGKDFKLKISGNSNDLKTYSPVLNRLLKGNTNVSGIIIRNKHHFVARKVQAENAQFFLQADGRYANDDSALYINFDLKDLKTINHNASGPVKINTTLRGYDRFQAFATKAEIPTGKFRGKIIENFVLKSDVIFDKFAPKQDNYNLQLRGSGNFMNEPLSLYANVLNNKGNLSIKDAELRLKAVQLQADLHQTKQQRENNLWQGAFNLNTTDLSNLTDLLFLHGSGKANAHIILDTDNNTQNINIDAKGEKILFENNKIENLNAKAYVTDLLGKLQINGYLNGKNIHLNLKNIAGASNNLLINNINIKATPQNEDTTIALQTTINKENTINLSAQIISNNHSSKNILLEQFNFRKGSYALALAQKALINIKDENFKVQNLKFKANEGYINLNIDTENNNNLALSLQKFPANFINLFKPELQAQGNITGTLTANNIFEKPNIAFSMKAQNLKTFLSKSEHIPALNITAQGATSNNILNINSSIIAQNIDMTFKGSIAQDLPYETNLYLSFHKFPISFVKQFINLKDINGNLTGEASIQGPIVNPTIDFNISSNNLNSSLLAERNIKNINTQISGTYKNEKLSIKKLDFQDKNAINFSTKGTVSFYNEDIDLTVKGYVPLELTNIFLTKHGTKISGDLNLDAHFGGTLAKIDMAGKFDITKAKLLDTTTNINLIDVHIGGNFKGDRIILNSINGRSPLGGTLNGEGSISINSHENLDANIQGQFKKFRYSYGGAMVITTIDGPITVTGPLLKQPLIAGRAFLTNTEFNIPRKLHNVQQIVVKHKNPNPKIAQTLERADGNANVTQDKKDENNSKSPLLKVSINAPEQVFVRGLGLNVELGGNLTLSGTVKNVHPVGTLNMIRGTFNLGPQTVEFKDGSLSFNGHPNANLALNGQTAGKDININVNVSGTILDPKIGLTSSPALPPDEILAYLFFNRPLNELSPFQVAQLAMAAAQLTGLTDNSLLGFLRAKTGFDNLDIVTDAKGNIALCVGRYLLSDVYLELEFGPKEQAKGTINLNISKNLKTKGSISLGGNSEIGMFYEKDY